MNPIVEKVYQIGIIPVIAFNSVDEALPLCKALTEGGLPAAEVTFRTACAEECIRKIHEEMPEMLLGAGTVLTCEQADRAMAAGASFISFSLINNTVRLGIYARRFSIHTMKLVGASWDFIRRPFLRKAMLVGVVSALLADGFLVGWPASSCRCTCCLQP